MCFMCVVAGLTANVSLSLGISYTPSVAEDFTALQKMMDAIQSNHFSCSSLQSTHHALDKYTKDNYPERVRYIAGMGQEFIKLDASDDCKIK